MFCWTKQWPEIVHPTGFVFLNCIGPTPRRALGIGLAAVALASD
jgi:hypothetical protein